MIIGLRYKEKVEIRSSMVCNYMLITTTDTQYFEVIKFRYAL